MLLLCVCVQSAYMYKIYKYKHMFFVTEHSSMCKMCTNIKLIKCIVEK